MKKYMIAMLVIVSVLIPMAQAQAQEITAKKLTDDVLVVSGGGGNITAFDTDDGILVTDTFYTIKNAKLAREHIEKAFPGKKIVYVINTHYHFDHTAGNQVFKDAVIISHLNNFERIRTDYAGRSENLHADHERIAELETLLANQTDKESKHAEELKKELQRLVQIRENYGDFEFVPAELNLEKGARIELGDKTFYLNDFGPGHTDGDFVILCEQERVLVTGDLLFNKIIPYIDVDAGADVENWIAVLETIIERWTAYDFVVSGHGEVGTVDALKAQAAYLTDLWQAVKQAHSEGKTLDQAKAEITLEKYKDYQRYEHLDSNIEACWQILEW